MTASHISGHQSFQGLLFDKVWAKVDEGRGPQGKMRHKPLEFVSGASRGPQLNCATCRRIPKLLIPRFRDWDPRDGRGVQIYRIRRNLTSMFRSDSCKRDVSKAISKRLKHWRTSLGDYRFTVVLITDAENRETPPGRDPGSTWTIR